ncbi:FAD:protein FMN transferase [Myxococcaceae bacterium]|nr:FAD:protein FMN transferase [Myxococcaceae bacterium]
MSVWHRVAALVFAFALAPLTAGSTGTPAEEIVVSRLALGTLVSVVLRDPDPERGRAAIEKAFTEIERLEALLSEWRPESEVSRLNARAGGPLEPASQETLEMLERARDLARRSGGAFDPTVLPALRLFGFSGGPPRLATDSELDAVREAVGWEAIEVDPGSNRARLARQGAEFGTGAIGKGFIADRIAALLEREGVPAAMVRASGDLAFYGGSKQRPWPIGIEDPDHPGEILAEIDLVEGGVSTSAPTWRRFEASGIVVHHILDPRTLRPARGVRSVTVVAKDATTSDALSTALFVLGAGALDWLATNPDIEAVILFEDGRRTASRGLEVRWRD